MNAEGRSREGSAESGEKQVSAVPPSWNEPPRLDVLPVEEAPSPRLPRPGIPGSIVLCLVFVFVPEIVALPYVTVAVKVLKIKPTGPDDPRVLALQIPVQQAAMLALMYLVARIYADRDWMRELAVRLPPWQHGVLALVSLPAVMILVNLVHHLFQPILPTFQYDKLVEKLLNALSVREAVFAVALAPGIGEEIFCRGVLGRGLLARHGTVSGVFLTSIFFGILHFDPPYVVATALLGVVLHVAYLTSRSLLLPIAMHFANNFVSVLEVKDLVPLKGMEKATKSYWPILAVVALAFVAATSWAMICGRVRLRPSPDAWHPGYDGAAWPPPGREGDLERLPVGASAWFAVVATSCIFYAVLASITVACGH
jgi:membrane protease YdiL (CAAX protease family)